MLKGLFLLRTDAYENIYGPEERRDVEQLIDVYASEQTAESIAEDPSVLAKADVILSGWGMATMDEAFLAAAPKLKAVFYGAGTIKYFMTDAAWDRGTRARLVGTGARRHCASASDAGQPGFAARCPTRRGSRRTHALAAVAHHSSGACVPARATIGGIRERVNTVRVSTAHVT